MATANPGAGDWKWEGATTPSSLVAISQRHEPSGRLSGSCTNWRKGLPPICCTSWVKGTGEYTMVATAFQPRVSMRWSRTLGSQKRIVWLQQTQAGNAPTIVRHAILVLPSPFWLEVSLVSPVKGRAVWGSITQRHPVLPTPEPESLLLQR